MSIKPILSMNEAFFLRKEDRSPKWHLIDAKGETLGRLATRIATVLRGKDKAYFTRHIDSGDYVVVINAEQIVLTGNKLIDKRYDYYTGWMGGYRTKTVQEMSAKNPGAIIHHAVKGMLPKTKLARQVIKKLKVYKGSEHPHRAQILPQSA